MRYYQDFIGKRISKKFGSGEVVVGVENSNLSVKFLRYYIWAIPLIPTLCILFNIYNFFLIFTIEQFTLLMIGFIIALFTTIITILGSIYKLYIKNNCIILENMLKMKTSIDINKYPRIYIRQRVFSNYSTIKANNGRNPYSEHEEYILSIEQNTSLIQLPLKTRGVEEFLDNLVIQTLENLSQEEQEKSINKEEKFFFDIQNFCQKRRVIGVKNNSQNLKIKHGSNKNTIILYILSFLSLVLITWCAIYNIYEVVIAFALLIVLFIILLIREKLKNTLRISYYEDEIIQINGYILDYKNDVLNFEIGAIQVPYKNEKYNYSLTIHTGNDTFSISLNGVEEEKFTMFINNLILE